MLRALLLVAVLAACRDDNAAAPKPAERSAAHAAPAIDVRAEIKQRTLKSRLEKGPVWLYLDARRPGVRVPEQHHLDPQLVLRVGFHLDPPIPDLAVDASGVIATLTFQGKPFRCVLPWTAIYAMKGEDDTEKQASIWNEDVPSDAYVPGTK